MLRLTGSLLKKQDYTVAVVRIVVKFLHGGLHDPSTLDQRTHYKINGTAHTYPEISASNALASSIPSNDARNSIAFLR